MPPRSYYVSSSSDEVEKLTKQIKTMAAPSEAQEKTVPGSTVLLEPTVPTTVAEVTNLTPIQMHNATVNESSDSDERRERLDNATNTSLSLRKQAQAVKLLHRIENDLNATGIRFTNESGPESDHFPEGTLSLGHWAIIMF